MIILSVNSGSSSLKFQLFTMPQEETLVLGQIEKIGLKDSIVTVKYNGKKDVDIVDVNDHKQAVTILLETLTRIGVLKDIEDIKGVGHRVVHGGEVFDHSVVIDDAVVQKIDELSSLAPLHNPVNLVGIEAFRNVLPHATHVAVFDTAFHQSMKPENYMYPIPYQYYENYKIRRYGFHGTSHFYVSRKVCELMQRDPENTNIITLHLGNGASITAIENGKSIMTSMGFTPLAGIMMGTRSGDIDPAIMTFIVDHEDKTSDEVLDVLNKESGMLGVSGLSSDARDIISKYEEGNPRAALTLDIYANRVAETVGSYFVKLGHVDALVFTGGIGENSSFIRERVLKNIQEAMGLELNWDINASTIGEIAKFSNDASKSEVWVIPTNEELVLARDTFEKI